MIRATLLPFLLTVPVLAQDEAPPNFEDHVAPILRENCFSCHRGSRARNGLDLRSAAGILKGGSSGAAVLPGDPDGSLLVQVINHSREPFMPPDEPPLDGELLAVIEAWVAGGARATANDTGAASADPAGPIFVPAPTAGEAVLPVGVATQPSWSSLRANSVGALAASPNAPLVAVAGHQQVALYRVPEGELVGLLPFPEGEVSSLRFAASGALLVAGGGRGADRGLAVGWDVRTGQRVFELGDEPDLVLDADVTVDHGVVALGGPDRVVRAYSARSGELLYELTPHTDWITAVAFSPDGVLLATADRAGGVFVWEALTGREFHALPAQRGRVTSLSWRADSMLLAIGGDDGRVRSFEMERGRRAREFQAHGGVLAMQLLPSGRGVSAGRDGKATLWKENGRKVKDYGGAQGLATAVCATFDEQYVLVGDLGGQVRVFEAKGDQPIGTLRPNPSTDEERALAAARAALPGLEAAVAPSREAMDSARGSLAEAEQQLAAARAAAQPVFSRVAPAESALDASAVELQAAQAQVERYRGPQAQKDAAVEAARALSAQLEQAVSQARARLDQALTRAVLTEEAVVLAADEAAADALMEAQRVAAELLLGATARTQLAVSRAAEVRVAEEVALAAASSWRERAAPTLAALESAQAELDARRSDVATRKQEARAAEKVAYDATLAQQARSDEMTAAQAQLQQATDEVEAGRRAIAQCESAWESLRVELEASGGRVPR